MNQQSEFADHLKEVIAQLESEFGYDKVVAQPLPISRKIKLFKLTARRKAYARPSVRLARQHSTRLQSARSELCARWPVQI